MVCSWRTPPPFVGRKNDASLRDAALWIDRQHSQGSIWPSRRPRLLDGLAESPIALGTAPALVKQGALIAYRWPEALYNDS